MGVILECNEWQSTPSNLIKGLQVEGYGLTAMSSTYISSPLQAGLRGAIVRMTEKKEPRVRF
ncbi:MAG TPA: hypothetical protein VI037_07530 [Nitrososphaera sp.]